jgi:adenine-specific DNA-methyltransferase
MEIDKLDLRSHDIAEDKKQELLRLFPEIRTEGGKIDLERLKLILGETVDVGKERYGMNWPGKADCFKAIQSPSLGTLRPCPEESVNFDTTENLIIEGDNLEVLKLLQKSYLGKVKMIYIDPPYNTGNDFIYPDNYTESLQTYLEYTGQVDAQGKKFSTNTEADGRFHSKWLSMMYSRLYVARNILRDDGVFFISADDHEVDNLRKICDEILGEENFMAQIGVINNLKGRNDRKNVATCHEYLLIYGKTLEAELLGIPLSAGQRAEYKYTDENGEKYSLRDLRKRGRPDRREDRPNMFFPIYFNLRTKRCSLERSSEADVEILPKRGDESDGRWRWGRERVGQNLAILEPRYAKKNDRWDIDHRIYLKSAVATQINGEDDLDEDEEPTERTSKSKSFWMGGEFSTDVGRREFKTLVPEAEYDYPKSVSFLKRCLHLGLAAGDLVVDFFAGSGPTAQAALEMNKEDDGGRKFILVQLPELTGQEDYHTISEICKERVRRVIKKLNDATEGKLRLEGKQKQDRGFRVFKLAESNFKAWNANVPTGDVATLQEQLELHIDHIRDGRAAEDILYEILLKSGFPLTTPVEKLAIEGKTVFSTAGRALLICLERNLTLELIRAMAEQKPERIVCLDEGFAGNDQLKANAVQIFKTKGVTSFKTV